MCSVIGTSSYQNVIEVSRTAVISVFCDRGSPDAKVRATEIHAKRVVVQKSSEGTRRKKTYVEVEKAQFLKDFKDRKDLIKKAKFYPVRTRDKVTGRMKMIMVTKINDQKEGYTVVEDYEDNSVQSMNVIDDGKFILTEGQQDAAVSDAVAMIVEDERGGGAVGLTVEDVGVAGSSIGSSLAASRPSASAEVPSPQRPTQPVVVSPQKPTATAESSSEDEETPLDQKLRSHRQPDGQPAKAKAKGQSKKPGQRHVAGGKPGIGSAGSGGSGGGGGATDKSVRELLEEVDAAKAALKQAASLNEIKDELLSSLVGRLNTKKGQIAKRVGKDKSKQLVDLLDEVNTAKSHLAAIVEVFKAAQTFEKKRTRKAATTVGDKIHFMRSAGVTIDMLPICLSALSTYCRVFTSSCDQKWSDCSTGCLSHEISFELGGAVGVQDLGPIQRQAATLFLCELVRWQSEQKMITGTVVKQKLSDICEEMGKGAAATDLLTEMVMSVTCLMKDCSEAGDVRKAA